MTRLALALLLLSGCAAHGRKTLKIITSDDAPLNRDRTYVCAYNFDANQIVCVTPQEYMIRAGAAE